MRDDKDLNDVVEYLKSVDAALGLILRQLERSDARLARLEECIERVPNYDYSRSAIRTAKSP